MERHIWHAAQRTPELWLCLETSSLFILTLIWKKETRNLIVNHVMAESAQAGDDLKRIAVRPFLAITSSPLQRPGYRPIFLCRRPKSMSGNVDIGHVVSTPMNSKTRSDGTTILTDES